MAAPKRIFAGPSVNWQPQATCRTWENGDWDLDGENLTYAECGAEYIRADLVEARIAEAVKAEREACAAVADALAAEVENAVYRVMNANGRASMLNLANEADAIAEMIRARGDQ